MGRPAWGTASAILAQAGVVEDKSYYRGFRRLNEKAVLTVAMRIQAAWKANDAKAFARVFAPNGSLLMRDTQLTSRDEIRDYMEAGFSGPLKGAYVRGWPTAMKFLTRQVAMFVTEGGIIMPGEPDIQPQNFIRATWVVLKQPDGELNLLSHHSSPVKG